MGLLSNGVGFSSCDANKLSYYAKWILAGKHLSGKYLEDALKKLLKYSKQAIRLSIKDNTDLISTELSAETCPHGLEAI